MASKMILEILLVCFYRFCIQVIIVPVVQKARPHDLLGVLSLALVIGLWWTRSGGLNEAAMVINQGSPGVARRKKKSGGIERGLCMW